MTNFSLTILNILKFTIRISYKIKMSKRLQSNNLWKIWSNRLRKKILGKKSKYQRRKWRCIFRTFCWSLVAVILWLRRRKIWG